ncbi:MAG: hypothetical protein QNJ47_05125 [Nostocaceae cyanobacterium]|nr:hypothetical protein [Nostocaceae cyanobacterium]
MQRLFKSLVTISALSTLVISPLVLSANPAAAESNNKGTDASYVGAGIGGGITNGGADNDAATFSGNLTGRVKLPKLPVSARTQIIWTNDTTAIIPQISVDAPILKGTNAYVGVGYSFVEAKDGRQNSGVGNRDAVAVTVGVESEVVKNILVYSNATVGIDAYENSSASAVNVGGGIAYRFK